MTDEQKRLRIWVSEKGGLKRLSRAISENAGYLSAVMSGKRRASNRLRAKLGLQPRTAPAPCCPRCGVPHVSKRCTYRPTLEERAAQYDAWLARNAATLAEWVNWASGS